MEKLERCPPQERACHSPWMYHVACVLRHYVEMEEAEPIITDVHDPLGVYSQRGRRYPGNVYELEYEGFSKDRSTRSGTWTPTPPSRTRAARTQRRWKRILLRLERCCAGDLEEGQQPHSRSGAHPSSAIRPHRLGFRGRSVRRHQTAKGCRRLFWPVRAGYRVTLNRLEHSGPTSCPTRCAGSRASQEGQKKPVAGDQ